MNQRSTGEIACEGKQTLGNREFQPRNANDLTIIGKETRVISCV